MRVELNHDEIPVSVTEILPAAINTPIYDKGMNKMPFKPRAVPPFYNPKIVADAILFAAENPVNDLIAGGAGLGVVLGERISPDAAEWLSEKIGFAFQKTDEPSSGHYAGSLFEPVSGFDTIEGRFSDEQLNSDPYTYLKTNPAVSNALLLAAGGILGGYLIWRSRKSRDE